jgi:cobalt-zinc-cadmium efflux system outer membrane protein
MVGQVLPVSGRLGLQVRAANAAVDATSSRVEDEIRRARADVRLAFAQLLSAQTRERELTRARNRLDELVNVIAKREAAGDAAGFDRLRAEREVIDVEADRAAAAADRSSAQARLAAFLAQPVQPAQIEAVDSAVERPLLPAIDALTSRAESIRGELIALQKDIEAAEFSERAAGRRLVPEPELTVGTKSSDVRGGDLGSVVMVQATVPLFDRARADRAQARARGDQARVRLLAFRAVLAAEIAAQRATVVERRDAAARYRTSAVVSAEQVERIAQVSYDAGERGILELLDAYRSGATARVRQAALDLALRQAEIELEFLSGWEIP